MCGKTEHDDTKKGAKEELLCGPEISFAEREIEVKAFAFCILGLLVVILMLLCTQENAEDRRDTCSWLRHTFPHSRGTFIWAKCI